MPAIPKAFSTLFGIAKTAFTHIVGYFRAIKKPTLSSGHTAAPEFETTSVEEVVPPTGYRVDPDILKGTPPPPYRRIRTADAHPIAPTLRRAAVIDICNYLDLPYVPTDIFTLAEELQDPGQAISDYAESFGIDPIALAKKDPHALEQMFIIVDTLAHLPHIAKNWSTAEETAFVIRYKELATEGNTADLIKLFEAVKKIEALLEQYKILGPQDDTFKACASFMASVAEYSLKPSELTDDIIELIEGVGSEYIKQAYHLRQAQEAFDGIVTRLKSHWSSKHDGTDLETQLNTILAGYRTTCEELAQNPDVDLDQCTDFIDEIFAGAELLEDLIETLKSASHKDSGKDSRDRSDKGSSGHSSRHKAYSLFEEALDFFGYLPSARPSLQEFNKVYKKFVRDHHPDLVADEAEKAVKEERLKRGNAYADVIKDEIKRRAS